MLELKNLTVRFGGRAVLDGLSATIPLTGTTGVFGASGSGKTTLLRVLLGLQRPDAGEVAGLDGLKIAAVFQEDRLLPWLTARENVALVTNRDGEAARCLTALGLGEAMDEKPAALSGGMKRRVAIARALAFHGDLLLLDEPFTGLDDEARRLCAEALLAAHKPIVLVTHSEEEAALLACQTRIMLPGAPYTG